MQWEPVLAPADGEEEPPGLPPFAESVERANRSDSAKSFAKEVPFLVIVAMVAAFLVRTFVFQAFYIPSPSMGCAGCPVHTLEIDDKIVVSKLSYRLHDPRRGDVVVFDCPPAAQCQDTPQTGNVARRALSWFGQRIGLVPPSTEDYIKRVIALPGETVEIENGLVFIDGRPLDEPYLPQDMRTDAPSSFPQPYVVPPDGLLVFGDNRPNSSDGRRFLAIEKKSVIGRAVIRLWPLDRFGFL